MPKKKEETKEPELKFNGQAEIKGDLIDGKPIDNLISELKKLKERYPDEVLTLDLDTGSVDFTRYKVTTGG